MSEPFQPQDAFGLMRSYSRHRDYVRAAIAHIVNALEQRAIIHDASKMLDDEFSGFSRINAAARVHKFGSPEYKAGMDQERATINAHFARNSHHPERESLLASRGDVGEQLAYQSGRETTGTMTFLDVIEMVCDWHGARKGYDDPRPWRDSVELNFKAKGKYLSPEQRWLAEQVAQFLEPFA